MFDRLWLENTGYCLCAYFKNASIKHLYYAVEARADKAHTAGAQTAGSGALGSGFGNLKLAAQGQGIRRPGTATPDRPLGQASFLISRALGHQLLLN